MEVMDAIEKRYSVRDYADREIEKDKLDVLYDLGSSFSWITILLAGMV